MDRSIPGDGATPDGERTDALLAIAESGRFLSTAMVLFHGTLSKRVGLRATEEKVLELVRRHGSRSVGDLASDTGMAKNSISDLVDRLETRGFVVREVDSSDRRRVRVIATEDGAARIGVLFIGLMTGLAELHDDYSTEELLLIADYQRRAAEIQMAAAHDLEENAEDT